MIFIPFPETAKASENESEAFLLDTRSYPQRAVDEPTGESIVRGSHDGFVENLIKKENLEQEIR